MAPLSLEDKLSCFPPFTKFDYLRTRLSLCKTFQAPLLSSSSGITQPPDYVLKGHLGHLFLAKLAPPHYLSSDTGKYQNPKWNAGFTIFNPHCFQVHSPYCNLSIQEHDYWRIQKKVWLKLNNFLSPKTICFTLYL